MHRLDEAVDRFARLLAVCNDVGLLSEQFDPERKCMLGNFPQAFSHAALVNRAMNLERKQGPSRHRAEK